MERIPFKNVSGDPDFPKILQFLPEVYLKIYKCCSTTYITFKGFKRQQNYKKDKVLLKIRTTIDFFNFV